MSRTASGVVIGVGGVRRAACAAVQVDGHVTGLCGQERVTRVKNAGSNPSGLPDEAVDLLLARSGRTRADVNDYVIAEEPLPGAGQPRWTRIDHHRAHAEAAYLSSDLPAAVVLVCDHDAPKMSVWRSTGSSIEASTDAWVGPGLTDTYSTCARIAGFQTVAGDQRFEALARLAPDAHDERLPMADVTATSLGLPRAWEQQIADWWRQTSGTDLMSQAQSAAALQRWVADLLVRWVAAIRRGVDRTAVCLGGSLFHHSSLNTAVQTSGLFERTFVPVHPGNAGLALAGALRGAERPSAPISPFLGPSFSPDEIKETLDNCKLRYDFLTEGQVVDAAVDALVQGRIVAWFEGAMEWGPRALGGRSILANPFDRYVLENLNRFLKRREPWRGYALSALTTAVPEHFHGPAHSPFMECDSRPRDTERFAPVLPVPTAALRLHTVDAQAPRRFRTLLAAFGDRTGVPCLVNTSFNGFHEPIVCSPRDAVRVFYGTGVDTMLLDRFLVTK